MVLLAEEGGVPVDTQLARQMLRWSAIGAVADHQQVRRRLFTDFGQNPDAVENALYRTEVGQVDQQLLAPRRELRRSSLLRIGTVEIDIDEVLDHADLVIH